MFGLDGMVSKFGFRTGEYYHQAKLGGALRFGYQRMLSERIAIRGFVAPELRRSARKTSGYLDEFGPTPPDIHWKGIQLNVVTPLYLCYFLGEKKLWNVMLGASHSFNTYEWNSIREEGSTETTQYSHWNFTGQGFSARMAAAYRMRLDAQWGIDLVAEGVCGVRHDFSYHPSVRPWNVALGMILYPKFE